MSAKTHFPKKVTFTDSGTYGFWEEEPHMGPSSSLFFSPPPTTSCHSLSHHFIQSHRMAAPFLLELMSLFPHTLTPCWYSSHPESCRGLSLLLRSLLLPLSQRSLSLNMVLNSEVPSPPQPPHTQGPASPSWLCCVFRNRTFVSRPPTGCVTCLSPS